MTERDIHAHCEILKSAIINNIGEDPDNPTIELIVGSAIELLKGFLSDVNRIAGK